MHFTTKVPLLKSKNPIDYNSKIMSLGSCFAVNMSEKFDYYKFQSTCNPFGIIFNSVSIEKLVDRAVNKLFFTEKDIFFHNDLWHCFEVHSELSNPNKEEFLNHLNTLIDTFYSQIATINHCVITYGTSWVYRNKVSNAIVANCHKVPQTAFSKEILSPEAISISIQNTINLIHKINPDCKIIFTVSPVRHLKDGFVENQVSKAHLITAIYQLQNRQNTAYFPSYEIMMDELRDYRFYAEDLIHPSAVAINYIWERFAETHLSLESISVMEEIATIQKGLAHRPFNPESESHKKFVENLNKKLNSIQKRHEFIEFHSK
jgi:hypothetical protein